ncbi:phytoene dehydrogenase-like protein [Micromonospora pisi]|uniref:Phytoene dehydrogenase-like protein n=1 Tax=Micromonospora pisi TaxID=589240 RepID=A0A495JFE5_9ACTN|nr:NAD(P)/FAD-dependent oxidoreductase [Micromonospora pisi]RKR87603.1 phytoene dehydrogenase-like protein [Micromonospora pisi]
MPADTDVVIVGGGLAGLAAARRLHRAGVPWLLVEATERLGGRVATDRIDGYLLDRGFQVLNTAYPRLGTLLDLHTLRLGFFTSGVLVRRNGRLHRLSNPLRDPIAAPLSASADIGTFRDRLRLAALAASCAATPVHRLLDTPEQSTERALRRAGLSDRIIEELLRPFLSGVLADRALDTSSHVTALIARSFVRGRIGVPADGMGALPAAVAAPLPRTLLRLGTPVTSINPGRVRTPDGEIRCRAVLVATDPGTATELIPTLGPVRTRALSTFYHSVGAAPLDEPVLLLDGDRREIVANTVVISRAAPTYAPPGRHLVATSVVGPTPPPEPIVRAELARLYGCRTDHWEHLETVRLPAALPAAAPRQGRLRQAVDLGDGVFVAGDHRDSPSIQGALASGWRAGAAIVRHLVPGS